MRKYLPLVIIITAAVFFLLPENTFGQATSSGFAISIPIADENANDGHIICSTEEGFVLCSETYDPRIAGILVDNPAASFEAEGDPTTRLVQSIGNVTVQVSAENGAISEGDLITTSEISGVGQKATENGFVVGSSLGDFEGSSGDDRGRVLVAIKIHPAAGVSGPRGDLLRLLRQGVGAPLFEPLDAFRYFLAALMIVLAFSLGFIYFGRVAKTGIEAMGRNPMASRMIQITVLFNIGITIIIVLIGLAIAYLILIL